MIPSSVRARLMYVASMVRISHSLHLKSYDIETFFSCTGGLGEAVASSLSEETGIVIKRLAVTEVPRSGQPAELMEKYGISRNCIIKAVKSMLGQAQTKN